MGQPARPSEIVQHETASANNKNIPYLMPSSLHQSFSYGELRKDGDIHISSATINKIVANDDERIMETIEVLIFDFHQQVDDHGYQVTAVLVLPQR